MLTRMVSGLKEESFSNGQKKMQVITFLLYVEIDTGSIILFTKQELWNSAVERYLINMPKVTKSLRFPHRDGLQKNNHIIEFVPEDFSLLKYQKLIINQLLHSAIRMYMVKYYINGKNQLIIEYQ